MKSDPQLPDIKTLEKRMRPGMLSQEGFLGENETLTAVLNRDRLTLHQLGIECEQIASRLEMLIDAALRTKSHKTRVEQFKVTVTVFSGFQICPWTSDIDQGQCQAGRGVRFAHLDWEIKNCRTGRTLHGPGLLVHLIREHHFFEGLQSPYRVGPEKLVEHLGLRPESPD